MVLLVRLVGAWNAVAYIPTNDTHAQINYDKHRTHRTPSATMASTTRSAAGFVPSPACEEGEAKKQAWRKRTICRSRRRGSSVRWWWLVGLVVEVSALVLCVCIFLGRGGVGIGGRFFFGEAHSID